MAQKSALIVYGGWEGHEPGPVSELFADMLEAEGFATTREDSLDAFLDTDRLDATTLIVPVWTMASITDDQLKAVTTAVAEHGAGLAGCHGGMNDAFRMATEWQFMTGGQWVSHPGNDGVRYTVNIADPEHPITRGLPDFEVVSEQYYLHVDPGAKILATTPFPTPGVEGPHTANPCAMPQVYTKMYGKGRVYYNALGHHRDVLEAEVPRELMRRGLLWAANAL